MHFSTFLGYLKRDHLGQLEQSLSMCSAGHFDNLLTLPLHRCNILSIRDNYMSEPVSGLLSDSVFRKHVSTVWGKGGAKKAAKEEQTLL